MEWQQLVGFYSVVKFGSFTRAAEATFRTQSALSQQIGKLETELQCKLFDRIGKQEISLTAEGKAFYRFASETLLKEKDFHRELEEIRGGTTGYVSVAAPLGVLHFLLGEPLNEFQILHPRVELFISHLNPQECIDAVMNGSMDYCLAHGSTIPKTLKAVPWKRVQYTLMVPKGHPLGQAETIELEDLARYPLILPRKDAKFTARSKLDAKFNAIGARYRVILETMNILLNADFVSRGMGISFILCYEPMKEQYAERIDFIPMDDLFPPEDIAIVMRKDRWMSGAKREFLDFVLRF